MDKAFQSFHRTDYLSNDPIQFAHRYQKASDRELVAFLSALSAYGRVELIHQFLNRLLERLGPYPSEFLRSASNREIKKASQGLYYRFYREEDVASILVCLSQSLKSFESLEEHFKAHRSDDLLLSLDNFLKSLRDDCPKSYGTRFFFPKVQSSVAKRVHLFLRWVIRKDEIDLGLWSSVKSSELYVPLDVHLFRAGKSLGFIRRKQADFKAMIELTEALRKIDPEDPTKYDFALCRMGVLRADPKSLSL